MDSNQIEDIFCDKLNTMDRLDEVEATAISWFLDDYKACADNFVKQIYFLLVNPMNAKHYVRELPVMNLFLIIDVMISKCDKKYTELVSKMILEVVQLVLQRLDPETAKELRGLIDTWTGNKYFDEGISTELQNIFKMQNRQMNQVFMATPLIYSGAEKFEEEKLNIEPQGSRGWIKPLPDWITGQHTIVEIPLQTN